MAVWQIISYAWFKDLERSASCNEFRFLDLHYSFFDMLEPEVHGETRSGLEKRETISRQQ